MSGLPPHTAVPFSNERQQIVDFLKIGKSKHTAYGIVELDITGVRDQLRRHGRTHGQPLSLTSYLIYCFVQAVAADKKMQAYRHGKKLIYFDDVDVATMVERHIEGERTPVSYILRAAQNKSIYEISHEIKEAKLHDSTALIDSEEMINKKWLYDTIRRTGFLRRWFLRRMAQNPFLKKKINGTIGFSSMGMFSSDNAGWIVPITPHTLTAMVGGIRHIPSLRNGVLVDREWISITIAMDHDILDGAPTARFIERYRKLLIGGLPEPAEVVST
ncbi:MAG: 2-oxo acid dehydrogenase subunit E2 [Cyclobacteriaceae bacterium]|nr:2-oxo acid dehydrogenase subunit E2 [Cyclobacteriaceae bacterium]